MNNLTDMIWIESRKAVRSGMPLWTTLASMFMPLGLALLILISKNPEISQKLGIISAKANLMAFAGTDWPSYLGLYGQVIAAGGFILFIFIISWVFGREFMDGTIIDILAVPVARSSILMAKFIVMIFWSLAMTLVIILTGLIIGFIINLPGGTLDGFNQGLTIIIVTAFLTIIVDLPFALLASVGRGVLLPIGSAIIMMILVNFAAVLGWGDLFPWAIPGIYAQGKTVLGVVSYLTVVLTGLAGMAATYFWWLTADQNG